MQNINIAKFDSMTGAMRDERLRARAGSLDPREMLKRLSDLKKLPNGCKVPPVPELVSKGKSVPPGQ